MVVVPNVDVTVPDGLVALVNALPPQPISLLVINAGMLHADTLDTIDMDAVLQQVQECVEGCE